MMMALLGQVPSVNCSDAWPSLAFLILNVMKHGRAVVDTIVWSDSTVVLPLSYPYDCCLTTRLTCMVHVQPA